MSANAQTTARARAWLLCLAGVAVCACVVMCACVVVCVRGAAAQEAERVWLWQNPLPQGNAIYAVRFAADKHTGWAVGADGVILHTTDGGFRWEEQHALTPVPLYGLFVKDARRAVAVGARGLVLTTNDGGRRWMIPQTAAKTHTNHLFSVALAPDALHGRAAGCYADVVQASDGGRTWAAQA